MVQGRNLATYSVGNKDEGNQAERSDTKELESSSDVWASETRGEFIPDQTGTNQGKLWSWRNWDPRKDAHLWRSGPEAQSLKDQFTRSRF